MDVPSPQTVGGVFTLGGLYESGRDCVTPKTGKVTLDGVCDSSSASEMPTPGNTRQSLQLQI